MSLRFPHQNTVYTSALTIHATCPAHLILLELNIQFLKFQGTAEVKIKWTTQLRCHIHEIVISLKFMLILQCPWFIYRRHHLLTGNTLLTPCHWQKLLLTYWRLCFQRVKLPCEILKFSLVND
jgi:hypothetical protein